LLRTSPNCGCQFAAAKTGKTQNQKLNAKGPMHEKKIKKNSLSP
jgi:hypothetical protein